MQKEIGTLAGHIWQSLNKEGELSAAKLKKMTQAKAPVFDWAVGWLMREDKTVVTPGEAILACPIEIVNAAARPGLPQLTRSGRGGLA